MKWFHRHKFDPEKWKLISAVEVVRRPRQTDVLTGMLQSTEPYSVGKRRLYSNTCTECGDLVFRRVQEIE